ncbi:TetR/AcrR family transcriptional regulator [Nocardioides sp. GCM10027113]|uniref:TetR/AcrR family transcriptional regulator n=1 Tax=unclassified Nocardioides TaxID=2615069 RepID=UPI00360890CD
MIDRREQILIAAQGIANESGLSAMTVRNVAERAAIGASTLRHYFPTQQALYDAVVGRSFDSQLSDRRIRDRRVGAARRLVECLAQFLPEHERDRHRLDGWVGLYAAAVGPARTDAGGRLLSSLAGHARTRVDGWLAVLDSESRLQPGSREQHTTTCLALVDGLCLGLVARPAEVSVAEAHAVLADVVTRAVVADGVH